MDAPDVGHNVMSGIKQSIYEKKMKKKNKEKIGKIKETKEVVN